jgi:hypothetical protein
VNELRSEGVALHAAAPVASCQSIEAAGVAIPRLRRIRLSVSRASVDVQYSQVIIDDDPAGYFLFYDSIHF